MRSIKPYEVLTKQIEDGAIIVYHTSKEKYILVYNSSSSSHSYNSAFVSLGTRLIVVTDSKNKFLHATFTTGLCTALKNIKVGLLKYANKNEIEVYRKYSTSIQ